MAIDHIVWDWNGTIFNDSTALIDSTLDAFAACGLPPITRMEYQRHHMQPIPEFYNKLAGRVLALHEQEALDAHFQRAYAIRRDHIPLNHESLDVLTSWRAIGSQSLLSMHPHDRLMKLIAKHEIGSYFARIDGSVDRVLTRKAPYLARHIAEQGLRPEQVLVVGDSVDDAYAALECGATCLLYHAGDDALHVRDHFEATGVPIVDSLSEVVRLALPHYLVER